MLCILFLFLFCPSLNALKFVALFYLFIYVYLLFCCLTYLKEREENYNKPCSQIFLSLTQVQLVKKTHSVIPENIKMLNYIMNILCQIAVVNNIRL